MKAKNNIIVYNCVAMLISVLIIAAGFFYTLSDNKFKEFDYDAKDWVTTKDTFLMLLNYICG